MSLSFCHHWSWIQTLKRPPYMIRGHVFFCQGRHPQGWWRFRAPGAHSLCCPRKTECCWNRDSVVPRRHFEGLKKPPRIRLRRFVKLTHPNDSCNGLTSFENELHWMTGHGNDVNLQKNTSHFEGLKWSELSTHVFTNPRSTNLWIFYEIVIYIITVQWTEE